MVAAHVPETPLWAALYRGVPCAFRRHVGPGQPLGELLGSDALGRAGRNIRPSDQPHDWRV